MRMHFLVTYEDKPDDQHEVVAWDNDMVALEAKYDIDVSILKDRQRFEWFAFLCWHALDRKGQAGGKNFQDWLAQGVEVDVKADATTTGDGDDAEGNASGEPAA